MTGPRGSDTARSMPSSPLFASFSDRIRALERRDGGPGGDVIERVRPGVVQTPEPRTPPMYRVVLLDDPGMCGHTVADTICQHFNKTRAEAIRIMLAAHNGQMASVGVYTREIAETRVNRARAFSRDQMQARYGIDRAISLDVTPEGRT